MLITTPFAGAAAIAVSTPDAAIAATAYATPMLIIWAAVGVLALGVAFVLLRVTVRRSRTA